MNISIRNFRGIAEADIDLSSLALIAGPNESGKTSIAQAVAAALSGQVIPLTGLRKTDAGMLVHAGTGKGTVKIQATDGFISVAYPQATLTTTGTPPSASLYAVGLASLIDLEPKARAAVLIEYLKAMPTEAQIAAAASVIGLNASSIALLQKTIVELGWDGAHAHAKETGIKLKGKWEFITSERYGPTKAESWLPAHWETDLASASEESLGAQVTQSREFVEAAIASTAVSDAERNQLEAAAAMIGDLLLKQALAQTTCEARQKEWTAALEAAERLPQLAADERSAPCPHCGLAVVIRGNMLAKPTTNDDADERDKRKTLLEAAAKDVVRATEAKGAAIDKAAEIALNLKRANAAKEKLRTFPVFSGSADIEHAREQATLAERRHQAFLSKRDADRIHANILINLQLQVMLAPDGLRLTMLRSALQQFNIELRGVCASAGWPTVALDDDASISYGGRPLILCSESGIFRTRTVLQVAMASLDGSAALVIDGADILDSPGRNGLMRMLRGLRALVCMTLPTEKVPRLGTAGVAYWLDQGRAAQIGAEVAA